MSFQDGIGEEEALREVHSALAAADLLHPERLQSAIAAYVAEDPERLGEGVSAALTVLDARLLARHCLLVEDLPLDALRRFCGQPRFLADEEQIRELRSQLYGEGKFPVLCKPAAREEHPSTVRRRQFLIERETITAAVREFHAAQLKMAEEGRSAAAPKKVQVWMRWVGAMARSIEELRKEGAATPTGRGAKAIQMVRDMPLTPELLGVITCQTLLNLVYLPSWHSRSPVVQAGQTNSTGSVPFVTAVVAVGEAVEAESWLRDKTSPLLSLRSGKTVSRAKMAAIRSRRQSGTAGVWDKRTETVPIGAALLDMLIQHAKVETSRSNLPFEEQEELEGSSSSDKVLAKAFCHDLRREGKKLIGYLELRSFARQQMDYQADIMPMVEPKYQPMLMEPEPWRPAAQMGGYLMHQVPFVRTTAPAMACLNFYSPARVARIMDGLGRTPWRVNDQILGLMREAQRRDLAIAEVPPKEAPEVPKLPDDIASRPQEERERLLLKRHLADKRVMELQSEWPTFEFKLQVAENFLHAEKIYFPHNVDFRGRAYPVPPHLNHISDDICRGLLTFAESKPLGKEGAFWLKISLANLMGKNKLPFDERIAYVEDSRDWIMEVARDPLAEKNIERWADADDGPWQALARCIELARMWESGDEQGFCSPLPVHLDGSCNGLQHYAAIGRDAIGAKAVNLLPSDRPQDVYTVVLGIVKYKIEMDARCDEEDESKAAKHGRMARRLIGLNALQRKVVKQTVMTICYGVTRIGAQKQVQSHLSDLVGQQVGPEELKSLSVYLSGLVLASIDEVFERAMQIKRWFDAISGILNSLDHPTSWMSPIGLACVQPYKKQRSVTVLSSRQRISLNHGEARSVQKAKQRMGFPPNFIHSLDATHMMMVAEGCGEEGITFAGVHDSFWTHPCDAPVLNRVIRSKFKELHEQPILRDLHADLCIRLGGREVPPLPQQGELDLSQVLDSPYIFN